MERIFVDYAYGKNVNYDPSLFYSVDTLERAKWVILTPDGVHTPEERWQLETPWLIKKITDWLPTRGSKCLDYGCGIGRLAKPLIEERGWWVMGVDISPPMLKHAMEYVGPARFLATNLGGLDSLLHFGVQFDFAIVSWVLQHCEKPTEDIARIKAAVKPGGRVFVLNAYSHRFVPIVNGNKGEWCEDGINIWQLLADAFVPLRGDPMPQDIAPGGMWAVYERGVD